jgi:hypothetical protein
MWQAIFQFIQEGSVFWLFGSVGFGLFLMQFILSVFGGEQGSEEGSFSDAIRFKWLSKQALTGFLMLFGLSGLTCLKEFGFSPALSVAIAFVVGSITVIVSGVVFKGARKLHSSGHVFNIEEAVGKQAMVYQRIPKNGSGKISINLSEITHELNAISMHGEELDSFTPVKILKKMDEKTVVVVPYKGGSL